jgi:hypothetical protein
MCRFRCRRREGPVEAGPHATDQALRPVAVEVGDA